MNVVNRRSTIAALVIAAALVGVLMFSFGRSTSDPRSTFAGSGGGGLIKVLVDELPLVSDLAVRATVRRVDDVSLTTPSGRYPPRDPVTGRFPRYASVTPVEIQILEVIGRRSDLSTVDRSLLGSVRAGDRLTLTVAGGIYTQTFSVAEARARGITVVPPGTAAGDEDRLAAPPTEPVERSAGTGTSINLTEGDEVILFLTVSTSELRGDYVHVAGSGQGAFILEGDQVRTALPDRPTLLALNRIRQVAASVSSQLGRSVDVDSLSGLRAGG